MENDNQNLGQQAPEPAPAVPAQPTSEPAKKDPLLVVGTYVLFFLPLIVEKIKNDEFYRFHMRQSLGLLIAEVLAGIISSIVPFVGGIIHLGVFVLWVIGLIGALQGKTEPVPVLGEYFKKINI